MQYRKIFSKIFAVVTIFSFLFGNYSIMQAATYYWNQSTWQMPVTSNIAVHNIPSGYATSSWAQYSATTTYLTTGDSLQITASTTSFLDTDFNTGTTTQTAVSSNSVKLAIIPQSGNGADGPLTISSSYDLTVDNVSGVKNTDSGKITTRTQPDGVNWQIDGNISAGATSVSSNITKPNGLDVGDEVIIINLKGTSGDYSNVGKYEFKTVTATTTTSITVDSILSNGYNGTTQKIMVQRVPNYTNVTIDPGGTLITSSWDGTKGGVLVFRANGTVTLSDSVVSPAYISATGKGFRGGVGGSYTSYSYSGETINGGSCLSGGYGGVSSVNGTSCYGGGGGGGQSSSTTRSGGTGSYGGGGGGGGGGGNCGGGGGGGKYGDSTGNGENGSNACLNCCSGSHAAGSGGGGGYYGNSSILNNVAYLGSGGGAGGGAYTGSYYGTNGGNGGGIIYIASQNIIINNNNNTVGILANGNDGIAETNGGGGGGGSGGSVIIISNTITNPYTNGIKASGGALGNSTIGRDGGAGGGGRTYARYQTLTGSAPSPNYSGGALANYYTSGIYTSSVVDTGQNNATSTLSWDANIISGTVSMAVKAAINSEDLNGKNWCDVVSSGNEILISANISAGCVEAGSRYFQYKASLSGNGSATPSLDSVTLGYTYYPTNQSLTSSIYNANVAENAMGSFMWDESSLPANTAVTFSMRASTSDALIPTTNWTDITSSSLPSGCSKNGTVVSCSNVPLTDKTNVQYFQYKVGFTTNGANTPVIASTTVAYVVNAPPEIAAGATAVQISDSTDPNWGKIKIEYRPRDTDTISNLVTPSFQYNIGGGLQNITAGYLSAGANNPVSVGVDYDATTTVYWDVKSQISDTATASAQVKIIINDGEQANYEGNVTVSSITIDTTAPTGGGVTFDAGVAGEVSTNGVSIAMPTDDSSLQYYIADDPTYASTTSQTGWTSISGNTSINWTFDTDVEKKYLQYKFRDAYGNTIATTTVSTADSIPTSSFLIQDVSKVSLADWRLYIGWATSTSDNYYSYKLEYATSTDNVSYSNYANISGTPITDRYTNYIVHTNLNNTLYYRYRIAVVDNDGNDVSVRSSAYTTAKPDGVQNHGEGGGGAVATASKVQNVVVAQGVNKNVTISYLLTDGSLSTKTSPSYEAYVFYNTDVSLPASAYDAINGTITVSDGSRLLSSGYIQINNEVIKYTAKNGNILSGLTRGTWPDYVSSGRYSRQNSDSSFFEGTPVWVMATSTNNIGITNTSIATGQSQTGASAITWNTYNETTLAGNTFSNVDVRVLVHDGQSASVGPLSSQNDYSEDSVLATLDLSVPAIQFTAPTSSSGVESVTPVNFNLELSRAYPYDASVNYAITGTATALDDYTVLLSSGIITIPAGSTSISTSTTIVDDGVYEGNETMIITLSSPSNASLGINTTYTYTIEDNDTANTAPEFNPTTGPNGLLVSQNSNSGDQNYGKVEIQYSVRDTNSTSAYVTPSFKYNIGGGWIDINSSYLNSGATDNKPVNTGVDSGTYIPYTAVWDVKSNFSQQYYSSTQVKATINDGAGNNNIASTTSAAFPIDTNNTSASMVLDIESGTWTMTASDDSNYNFRVSNNSDLSDDLVNTASTIPGGTWHSTTTAFTATSTWTFSADTYKKVYFETKDAYGNMASSTAVAPASPTSMSVRDISNVQLDQYKEFISWDIYTATTSAAFSKYELYRSTDGGINYSLLSTITNENQNYYNDTAVASTTTYHYKLRIIDTNNDKSAYSSVVNDTPDGQGGTDLIGPIISSVASTTQATWATITWTTDELSSSVVEYSTAAAGNYGSTASSSSFVLAHEVTLTGLASSTDYVFRVKSTDIDSNQSTSANYTFATTRGPTISNVITTPGDNNAVISWDTDRDSNSYVVYSTNLSNLLSDTGVSEVGYATAVGGGGPTYHHQVSVTGLSSQTTYYFYVKSTDANSNLSTDRIDPGTSTYYQFTTTYDTDPPVISNISIPVTTANAIVVMWQTNNELSDSQVEYGTTSATSGSYQNSTTLNSTLSIMHVATLSGLTEQTTYYYRVKSKDANLNLATSTEQIATTTSAREIVIQQVGGGGAVASDKDTTAPSITNIQIKDIGPFGATVAFNTSEETTGFVLYGKDTNYGSTAGSSNYKNSHEIKVSGLKLGTDYHLKVRVSDKAGNFGISEDQTFTTKFAAEAAQDLVTLENAEGFQDQLEGIIESIMPSLVPPFIGKLEIIDVTENSVVVTWRTNVPAYGSIAYVADKDYDAKKSNPYVTELSQSEGKAKDHRIEVTGLSPATLYHLQAKSFVLPGVIGKSNDITFVTKASKIKAEVTKLGNTEVEIRWVTDMDTTSFVEFTNLRNKKMGKMGDNEKAKSHFIKLENLEPDTSYEIRVFGYDENSNLVEGDPLTIKTKRDITAPQISGVRIDNALLPGRTDRLQTVISWKTDEPSNSVVYFEEGAGVKEDLINKIGQENEYTTDHIVIVTNFKPATVYRVKIGSEDESSNNSITSIRTILTPRSPESVFDVIIRNFQETFGFLKKIQ